MPTSYLGGNLNDDGGSITQSYNQKVKEDTNFLAKQRDLYDDDDMHQSFKEKRRNESDVYNLSHRQSYAVMING